MFPKIVKEKMFSYFFFSFGVKFILFENCKVFCIQIINPAEK